MVKKWNVNTYIDDELVDGFKLGENLVSFFFGELTNIRVLLSSLVEFRDKYIGVISDVLNLKKLDFVPLDL